MTWIADLAARLQRRRLLAHADRVEAFARTVPRPVDRHRPVRIGPPGDAYRVLLFGSGPAAGWGVTQQDHGLGGAIAAALHHATGRAVEVEFLVDDHWEERDPVEALRARKLSSYDAVVVISAWRRALVELPLDRWRAYIDELRDVLIAEAGPEGYVQVLSLPWKDAITRMPDRWGGALGEKILALSHAGGDSLIEFRQVGTLVLAPPEDALEWAGPAFSAATYRWWGAQSAVELAWHLPAEPRRAAVSP